MQGHYYKLAKNIQRHHVDYRFRALDVAVRKLAAVWHGPFGRVEQGAACARCDEGGDVLPSRAAHQYVGLQV